MEAHANDLRAEVDDAAFVERFKQDWRTSGLDPVDTALMGYAEKVTREPWTCTAADVQALRDAGLTDDHVAHAVQVIGYFNYINRVADALGVDLEPEMPERP